MIVAYGQAWWDDNQHPVALELERTGKDELCLSWRWPDYLVETAPEVRVWVSGINLAALSSAGLALLQNELGKAPA